MAGTTTRMALPYPDGTDAPNVDLAIKNLALGIDSLGGIFGQGTFAARPVSTPGSPGKTGRWYVVTSGAETGQVYYDYGTGWIFVNPTTPPNVINQTGTLAARPAANSVSAGTTYFATDQVVEYVSDGTNWLRKGVPAGVTYDWFAPGAAAPAGHVKYDGTNLPASTGIYADLYAHLGNTLTTPNTKGKTIVGFDAGDADWDTIQETRGAKTHTLTTPEIPSHVHSNTVFAHSADNAGNSPTQIRDYASTPDTGAPNSGATGGGGAHNNLQPSIVALKIAKL